MIAFAHRRRASPSALDPDTAVFLLAAGIDRTILYHPGTAFQITGDAMAQAVDALTRGLKSAGLWTKTVALWPMVGGYAAAHQRGLKPYAPGSNLQFGGTETHSPTGLAFGLNPATSTAVSPVTLPRFAHALFYYTRDATTDANVGGHGVMGSAASTASSMLLCVNRTNFTGYFANSDAAGVSVQYATPQTGAFMGLRVSANYSAVIRNQTVEAISTVTDTGTLPSAAITIGRVQGATRTLSSCQTAAVLTNLSVAEALQFNALITQFNAALGRAV